jgi:hypothetical protein
MYSNHLGNVLASIGDKKLSVMSGAESFIPYFVSSYSLPIHKPQTPISKFQSPNSSPAPMTDRTALVTPTDEDASDFGNYHAGFTGSMFGVSVAIQKIGAGTVEQLKDVKAGDIQQAWDQYWGGLWPWERYTFMDESDDYYWNTQGMSDALYMKRKLNLGPNNLIGVQKK